MKKIYVLILICFSFEVVGAQVPSDCTVPQNLVNVYEHDIKNMAIRRMVEVQSADTAFVAIPQAWFDTIAEGLAAILNATSIPQRDSIFNIYCVHDNSTLLQTYNGLLVQVDTSYAWTDAWQNLVPLTGDPDVDVLVANYDLSVAQFYNWSFGNYALLHTDSLWNIYALIDTLETIPGIIYAEADAIIGAAGKIIFSQSGNDRYYDFYFEFSDCFDGCDNYRDWKYKVNPDCTVEYLGFEDWGVFGILPLPAPPNCNLFTSVPQTANEMYGHVFPNPASTMITISWKRKLNERADFILYDSNGREVKIMENIHGTELKVDVSRLPAAMYIFKIVERGQVIVTGKLDKK